MWAGIALFALIALEATVMVGVIIARSVGHLSDPAVIAGLLTSLVAVGSAVPGVIAVRWTPRDRRGRALSLMIGLALVALGRRVR